MKNTTIPYLLSFFSLLFLSWGTATTSSDVPSNKLEYVVNASQEMLTEEKDLKKRIALMLEVAEEKKRMDANISISLVEEAIRLSVNFGMDRELATARHILGKIKWRNNKFEEAIAYFYQASSLREQIQDSFGIVDSDIQIGKIYYEQNRLDEAEYFYGKAIRLCKEIDYQKGRIDGLMVLAELYFEKGVDEQAEQYMKKAMAFSEEIAYREGEIRGRIILGKYFLKLEDGEKAYTNFSEALQQIKWLDDPYLLVETLPLAGLALSNKPKEADAAEALVLESLSISREMNLPVNELEGLTTLSQLYERNGSFEKAYQTEKQRFDLNEKIIELNKEYSVADALVKYLGRDERVNELHTSNEILRNKQQISQLYLFSAFILVISIIVIVGILFIQLRKQSKSNLLLAEANLLMEEKNKELSETNSALERFAYVASHDLKEPLRTISSFTTLIARKYQPLLDNKGKEYVKFVVDGVSHMNYLLEDLLRYSRLVNKKDFVQEPVNLNQIVASVEQVLSKKIGECNAQIEYPEMPVVSSNSLHMHQLFQNLIANGLKFNDKSKPKVEISCQTEENKYLIAVKDNGIGIDKQYHGKIFEMFQRLSKNEYAGTGIGLSICQKIMELNQQKIWLESTPGQGTTFFFYLPKEQAN